MSELLDIEEAAKYLGGVHRATVYRIVKDNRLTIVKVRGSTRIERDELDRYLRSRRVTA